MFHHLISLCLFKFLLFLIAPQNRTVCAAAVLKVNTHFVIWKKHGFGGPNHERLIDTDSLVLKYSKPRQLALILLLNSKWMNFGWGPPLVLETHTHTPLLCQYWEVAFWLGLWEASPGRQLCWLHIPPNAILDWELGERPEPTFPQRKKTYCMYLEAH